MKMLALLTLVAKPSLRNSEDHHAIVTKSPNLHTHDDVCNQKAKKKHHDDS